ncbi:MAG: sulfotransferase, partial [Novosphingobium sp.]|nr:sulfotransferase [Novosphingobium sp.]
MSAPTDTLPNDIVIDDLAEPRLTPAIIAAREGPADFDENMTADQVLAHAVEMTGGLDDFGEDTGFRERLAVILQSLAEDEGLTRGGRITIVDHAIRVMANRLRIEDLVKRHPEILEIEIDRPLIIAGLPRSGTTHLVNWLSRDERLHSLTLWESEEPVPSAPPPPPGQPDPREQRSAE